MLDSGSGFWVWFDGHPKYVKWLEIIGAQIKCVSLWDPVSAVLNNFSCKERVSHLYIIHNFTFRIEDSVTVSACLSVHLPQKLIYDWDHISIHGTVLLKDDQNLD